MSSGSEPGSVHGMSDAHATSGGGFGDAAPSFHALQVPAHALSLIACHRMGVVSDVDALANQDVRDTAAALLDHDVSVDLQHAPCSGTRSE